VSEAGTTAQLEPPWPADALEVGRIADAWGVKGWLKVQPYSSDPQALFRSRRWFVQPPEDSARRPAVAAGRYPQSLAIEQVRAHGDGVVALAQGVGDRGAAEALRGARLFVARSIFPAAGKDEYYWVDLIGLAVRNRQGEALGSVAGLLDTGPHSVLRVRPSGSTDAAAPDEAERLIPFVSAYVDDVDLEQRLITVDWGLDY
jgi:16S rRNA processing protein RimM